MKFFFDNNLSPKIARALNALEGEHGHEVVHLKEIFDQGIADEEWMRRLGSEGDWIVLTTDYRITKNPHEVKAWQESGLTVFFLKNTWLRTDLWEQAWQLVKRWPKIVEVAQRNPTERQFLIPIRGAKFDRL